MLGSVGSIVPKRWILGIFALGLIATMVATSANPWAGAATLPSTVTATVVSATEVKVDWVAVDSGSTVPGGSPVVDGYSISCVGTPGTVIKAVTGIATTTGNVTGLTANTAYICSVSASSGSTLPSSGVAAASVTTTSTLLTSASVGPLTASVAQESGTHSFSVSTGGADSGLTITVSVDTAGSVNTTSSTTLSTTYVFTSSGAGTSVVTVNVKQDSTGIEKSKTITISKIAPPPEEPVVVPEDPAPADIPTPPSLGGNDQASTAVITPTTGGTVSISEPADGDEDFDSKTSGSIVVPIGALPSGSAFVLVVEKVPDTGSTTVASTTLKQEDFVPLPPNVTSLLASPLVIEFVDGAGDKQDVTLTESMTITMTVPIGTVLDAGLDFDSVSVFKAENPITGPWVELNTGFTINANGTVAFDVSVRNLSTFKLGSKSREVVTGGAVLPSAGDAAPTTSQALLLAGLGLMLVMGGGVYVRRQRRASAVD